VQRTVEELREATKSGGLVQRRKYADCRQGCRLAGSLGGRRRALISSSDRRADHVACDSILSRRYGFININDMYNNDVGKGGVLVYEAYEVK
jgi:hypothetical protein